MKSLDKGFRHLTRKDKLKKLVEYGWLDDENYEILLNHPLINEEVANSLIENVIGQGALPVGLLPRIIVDDKEYVVPMMVEEPSVVAAASYGAKLVNQSGGFKTISSERLMIGQIVFDDVEDTGTLANSIYQIESQIHQIADEAYPSIKARGGGYQRIEIDTFPNHQLLSRIIIATMITFTGTLSYQAIEQTHISHAAHNYYGKKQCTWWAFKRRAQLGKPVSNRWGNAKNWYSNARRSGYATGHKPRKYAVMQSTRGYYGHVAVVEKVYKNGKIKISEYNYNVPLGYGTRIISKSSARNYNYIY